MFTGIIQEIGKVIKIDKQTGKTVISIEFDSVKNSKIDDSISVNGVCLTIIKIENGVAHFDVLIETIKRTTLNNLLVGDSVNVEISATLSSKLGGHMVQGHVDCYGEIIETKENGDALECYIKVPSNICEMIVEKAYIALDGISLTIVSVDYKNNVFSVMLIPHTRKITIAKFFKQHYFINVEVDILNKSIFNYLKIFMEKNKGNLINE